MPVTKRGGIAAEVSGLHLQQLGYQQIEAATLAAATALTPSTGRTLEAVVQCSGGTIRFRCDGTDPTTALGNLLRDGETYILRGSDTIAVFKAIATAGAPVLDIGYWG